MGQASLFLEIDQDIEFHKLDQHMLLIIGNIQEEIIRDAGEKPVIEMTPAEEISVGSTGYDKFQSAIREAKKLLKEEVFYPIQEFESG